MTWYLLAVSLHILAACVWIGGMVFLAAVLLPVLREPEYRGAALPPSGRPRSGFGGRGGPRCSRWLSQVARTWCFEGTAGGKCGTGSCGRDGSGTCWR